MLDPRVPYSPSTLYSPSAYGPRSADEREGEGLAVEADGELAPFVPVPVAVQPTITVVTEMPTSAVVNFLLRGGMSSLGLVLVALLVFVAAST
jgi:hypothetical protein